ncbi:HdeD family acid-resistance protein [Conyzicola sp.]|uniref:HdeD family acid-resistance protein n=1 Tax=Conyzicola sp. TaxID=1969404 RepID=UPI0039897306
MTYEQNVVPGLPSSFISVHRGELVAVAVIGIVLGIIALVWPDATLVTIAIVFGIYLVVSGIFRITVAFLAHDSSTGMRWFTGILGLLVVAAGVYCLASPERSLVVLAFVIGFGWIAEGVIDIMAGIQGVVSPRWLALVSGVISIIAGIITFTLPSLAVSAFLIFGAILLIVVSVSTLLTLPRRHSVASM